MQDNNVLLNYIKHVSKQPLVTPKEEKELARKARMGCLLSKERLINANLRLVIKIAKEFKPNKEVSFMDIVQNGNIGLIKAVEKFDPDRGVTFCNYAAYWIRQSIIRGFLKSNFGGGVSYRMAESIKKVRDFILDFKEKNKRFPAVDEICREIKCKKSLAMDVLQSIVERNSNFKILCENGDAILSNLPDNRYNPEIVVENEIVKDDVEKMLCDVNERDRGVIKQRFGFEEKDEKSTLSDIGRRYSLSAEAIRQIEKKVLQYLRMKYSFMSVYLTMES